MSTLRGQSDIRIMMLTLTLDFLSVYAFNPSLAATDAPTAKTLNGTYQGRCLAEWDRDVFLGISSAQPPVGSLRYRWPQSLNASFAEVRPATQYGHSCMQYKATFNPNILAPTYWRTV
jgi:hypothetical protein